MNKRALIILGGILLLIIIGLVSIIVIRRKQAETKKQEQQQQINQQQQQQETPPPTEQPQTPPTTQTPPAVTNQAIKLTDNGVLSPVLFVQGNGITYFDSTGQATVVDIKTENNSLLLANKRTVSVPPQPNVTKVFWPAQSSNFIAELTSGGTKQWSLYSAQQNKYFALPNQIIGFDWMPSGEQMLVAWQDATGSVTLNTTNLDGSSYQTLAPLNNLDYAFEVAPNASQIIIWRAKNTDAQNSIGIMNIDGSGYKDLVTGGYNVGGYWSPDSKKFAFFKRDTSGVANQLWVADVQSGEVKNLGVTTAPEKIVWQSDSATIFAAGSQTQSSDTNQTAAPLGQQTILSVNVSTGAVQSFNPGISIDAVDLFIEQTGTYVLFKNTQDSQLYALKIK